MAQFRVWVWRFAMLSTVVTVSFFAWIAFATTGAPVFETTVLRSQTWQQHGFFLAQLGGICLWLLATLTAGRWRRSFKAGAAGVVLFACLLAMASEYDSLIEQGALRNPLDIAAHKLLVSQWLTLVLAMASVVLGCWARPRE